MAKAVSALAIYLGSFVSFRLELVLEALEVFGVFGFQLTWLPRSPCGSMRFYKRARRPSQTEPAGPHGSFLQVTL